jgi:hypothetical protein
MVLPSGLKDGSAQQFEGWSCPMEGWLVTNSLTIWWLIIRMLIVFYDFLFEKHPY